MVKADVNRLKVEHLPVYPRFPERSAGSKLGTVHELRPVLTENRLDRNAVQCWSSAVCGYPPSWRMTGTAVQK